LSKHETIWTKEDLARERTRAVFIVGVVGIFGIVRFTSIGQAFSKSFNLLEPMNVIDILNGFLIAYLILMIFAVSEDILGCTFARIARVLAYLALFFGFFMSILVLIIVNYFRAPSQTEFVIFIVGILIVYMYRRNLRKFITK